MKAIVAKRPGGPEVLELVDIEQPVSQEGEVKIRVHAFGLNKAESYYRSGNYGIFVPNQALGIEAVGEIIDDRSGAFRVGQRVATAMGGMMFTRHGGYAEYLTVNANNVVAIDSDLSFEQLALHIFRVKFFPNFRLKVLMSLLKCFPISKRIHIWDQIQILKLEWLTKFQQDHFHP